MIPIVYSMECMRITEPKDIPCIIYSTWKPTTGCSGDIEIFSENGTLVETTTWQDSIPYCNATFNITEEGTYAYNSTIEDGIVVVESEDNMTSLGIIIFLLILNGALFYIPFKIQFSKSKPTDYTIKNIVWVLGWVILTFNVTIFATLSDNAGLGITHELLVFQWIFLRAIYILMIFIFLKTMATVPKLLKEQRIAKRMGKDEG